MAFSSTCLVTAKINKPGQSSACDQILTKRYQWLWVHTVGAKYRVTHKEIPDHCVVPSINNSTMTIV